MHSRRPSDEAAIILRKISDAGQNLTFGQYNMGMSMPDKTGSLPPAMRGLPLDRMGYQTFFDDMPRFHTLGEFSSVHRCNNISALKLLFLLEQIDLKK